jgi:hypothetical protein
VIERIISGGQTGADRAALDWAIERRIPHGGWCPAGRLAEDGIIDARYQLKETPSAECPQRTEWNVRDSDGTVVFSVQSKFVGGSAKTVEIAREHGKPCLHLAVQSHGSDASTMLREFIRQHGIKVLNVAGSRASEEQNIGSFVGNTLLEILPTQELPPLTQLGFLPPGTYSVSLDEVQRVFAGGSPARETLWKKFLGFVDWIRGTEAFQAIEVGGSFLSAKPDPSDIDVALELRLAAEPVEPACPILNTGEINAIKDRYGVQVIVKKLHSEPYVARAEPGFPFSLNRVLAFRTLKKKEWPLLQKAQGRLPSHGEEFKGIVRIEL